jgi:hypothetical protein
VKKNPSLGSVCKVIFMKINDFEVLICSPYDKEKLVCEIYYKDELLAEISQETDALLLEIYL